METHSLLPPSAIEELQRAAAVPIEQDPNARAKAIDQAIDRLHQIYPERFRPDSD